MPHEENVPSSPTRALASLRAPSFQRLDALACAALVLGILASACDGSSSPAASSSMDAPLPTEDDLYAYSVAVAERAHAAVTRSRAVGLYHIGKVHERFGLEDRALEYYARAVEADANFALPHRDSGFILSQRKDRIAEAIEHYQLAIIADDRLSSIYTRIGMLLVHLDRVDEAVTALRHEIERKTDDEVTWLALGQAQALKGDHVAAVTSFRGALERRHEMREALYGLGRSLRALDRGDEAKSVEEKFREIKAKEDALELETRAKKDNRDDQRRFAARTWQDAANLFLHEGRGSDADTTAAFEARAVDAHRQAIRFDPALAASYEFLIEHHRRHAELPSAVEVARRSVEAIPGSPMLRFELALLLDQVAPRTPAGTPAPEISEALAHLDAAIAISPEFAPALGESARIILFRSRLPQLVPVALERAERALSITAAPQALNYDLIAWANVLLNRRDRALEVLRAGVERFPDDTGLRTRLSKLEELPR
jgi:tetratricopeptide (TPR) repeat protein